MANEESWTARDLSEKVKDRATRGNGNGAGRMEEDKEEEGEKTGKQGNRNREERLLTGKGAGRSPRPKRQISSSTAGAPDEIGRYPQRDGAEVTLVQWQRADG